MPRLDTPMILVTTVYPGASPEVVDASITSVIESAVNTVSGINSIQPTSSAGVSQITVRFLYKKSADVAFNEVQTRVNQVLNELPRDAEIPIVAKIARREFPEPQRQRRV